MQEMGNAFEIKRPATQNSLVHIQTAISKLHGNCKPKNNNRYPKKRKSNPNTTQLKNKERRKFIFKNYVKKYSSQCITSPYHWYLPPNP